jgi:hypothetical protein
LTANPLITPEHDHEHTFNEGYQILEGSRVMLTRILLDTCAVRNFLHKNGPKLDHSALILRAWKYRISIADGAISELIEQLTCSRLGFGDWQRKIHELDSLLDPKWPIFVGGRELSAIAGFQTDLNINHRESQIYHQSFWKLLRDSSSLKVLLDGICYRDATGKLVKLKPDAAHIKHTLDKDRKTWVDFIDDMRAAKITGGTTLGTLQGITKFLRSDFGAASTDPLNLDRRLDAVIRLLAQFAHMALNQPSQSQYNPSATNRRGDLFDWSLLFALPLPALIVTSDKRFVNRLKATNADDARQVLLIEDFNEHARNDTLESLLDHYRTTETQQRQWREAAYFNWLNRGCPFNDDLVDWFATEPIA